MPVPPPDPQGGGGGGGPPTGAAGGDLAGTYPNPTVGLLKITDAKVAAANKDGLANVPSLRTLGTGALQALPGNTDVSGTPAPATRYEAGGADPITNLGTLSDPLRVDSVIQPGMFAKLSDAGSGMQLDINDGSFNRVSLLVGDGLILRDTFGDMTAQLSEAILSLNNGTDSLNAGFGTLTLTNALGSTSIVPEKTEMRDASAVLRVATASDGTGVTLSDADAFARVLIVDDTSFGIRLKNVDDEVTAQLADGVLFAYAEGAQVLANPHGISWGTDGVTADVSVSTPTITGGAGTLLRTSDDGAGDERNMLYVYNMANAPQFVFAWRSVGGGGPLSAVFGATPYGQDAYLAPLDDNLSALTTLVDLVTAVNADRTRINAINGYLIARGWEAAA